MDTEDLHRIGQRRRDLLQELDELNLELQQAVRAGFEAGMTAVQMADIVGLTKPRIYQLRDGRR